MIIQIVAVVEIIDIEDIIIFKSLKGKRLSIQFEISSGDLKDTAKEIANATLSKFSEDELEFYELGYIINWTVETEEGKVINAIQGTKHPLKDGITWSNN